MDHADEVVGHQLAKAGFRLASLLNVWTQPVGPNDVTRAANSAQDQLLASRPPQAKSLVIDGARFTLGRMPNLRQDDDRESGRVPKPGGR